MQPAASPTFENLVLRSIAEAIATRRKAISFHTDGVVLGRSVDQRNGMTFESLDLEVKLSRDRLMKFRIWDDSMAWIYVRQTRSKVGIVLEVKLHADLWNVGPTDIVQRIEATLGRKRLPEMKGDPAQDCKEWIRRIWALEGRPPGKKRRR